MNLSILIISLAIINVSDGVQRKSFRDLITTVREPPLPRQQSNKSVVLEYIDQRVDNFNPQNTDTYKMRYYRNDEWFKSGGSILIEVGGEWTISPGRLRGGLMFDLARELNAQMFYTEHRYYGKSIPTPNATTSNLRYLSVDQALADLAHFIAHIKKEPGREQSKVFLFGCSYGGAMVTWFRQKYPHLVVGAKSASAPLLAKTNFVEYKEVVGAAVRYVGGEPCYGRLANAIKEAEELAATTTGWKQLTEIFNVCDTFDSDKQVDRWYFFAWLGYVFDGIVQYQERGDIERECGKLMSAQNVSDLQGFVNYFFGEDQEMARKYYCHDITFQELIDYYTTTEWNVGSTKYEDRQWTYQTCTEFGYFQSSGSPYQPFGSGFPVQYDYQKCADFYDKNMFNEKTINGFINRVNVMYGARNPAVKNVLFTQGRIDPWRTMGIQDNSNPHSPAHVVLNEAHCFDLESISSYDSEEVVAVKEHIKDFVRKLLK